MTKERLFFKELDLKKNDSHNDNEKQEQFWEASAELMRLEA